MMTSLYLLLSALIGLSYLPLALATSDVDRAEDRVQFRFYDVTFDETLCDGADQELRGEAYDNHIYLGRLLETKYAVTSQMCIKKCYQHAECSSINYYKPYRLGSKGFCELLAETQWENPKYMRPFAGGVYYERIVCETPNSGKAGHPNDAAPFYQSGGQSSTKPSAANSHFLKSLFNKIADFSRRAQSPTLSS